MSEQVTVGFGDESVAGVVRSDAGGLICREGTTTRPAGARIETLDAGASGPGPEGGAAGSPAGGPGGLPAGGAGGFPAGDAGGFPAGDAGGFPTGWRATAGGGLDVAFEPLGAPATFSDGTREWLCRARGEIDGVPVDCLGHAVIEPGPPRSWKRVALGRSVAAWLGDELAIALRAQRPSRAKNHEAEQLDGYVLRGSPPAPHPIDDPRLSTGYDAAGRQRRAGLELWETEESDYPLRLAGEAIGAGELELDGGMRLRCAFLVWHHAGRVGAGRYDIIVAGD